MSQTKTPRQLLVVALQDLHDAEVAWTERGTALLDAAGRDLSKFLEADLKRSAAQAQALKDLLGDLDAELEGHPNIWLRAILDDAERDARSIAPGGLLDTALVGAFRKGKQAERVSYATAIALARHLALREVEAPLTSCATQEDAADAALLKLLRDTVANLPAGGA